jgi:solute carrier family 66, member 2
MRGFIRIFYFPGARFDTALLIQSFLQILTQLVLLKIALDNRPSASSKGGDAAMPFQAAQDRLWENRRPYNFWQWRSPKPYWQFLLYLFIGLTAMELLLAPFHGIYGFYSRLVGYTGLTVEATLPLPQMYANARSRSCKGFRFSVLVSWLAGDAMKMFWFFTSTTEIPWAFKICGMFQAGCDMFLGVQYLMYGNGENSGAKSYQMSSYRASTFRSPNGRATSGRVTPSGRRTPVLEKSF